MVDGEQIWDRLKGEGPKAFNAFRIYRDQGLQRNRAEVARSLGKTRELLARWAKDYNWNARVAAWDAYQDQVRQEAYLDQIRREAEQEATISSAFIAKSVEGLKGVDPLEDLSPREILSYFVEGVKVRRQARGLPTEINEQRITESEAKFRQAIATLAGSLGDDGEPDEE